MLLFSRLERMRHFMNGCFLTIVLLTCVLLMCLAQHCPFACAHCVSSNPHNSLVGFELCVINVRPTQARPIVPMPFLLFKPAFKSSSHPSSSGDSFIMSALSPLNQHCEQRAIFGKEHKCETRKPYSLFSISEEP